MQVHLNTVFCKRYLWQYQTRILCFCRFLKCFMIVNAFRGLSTNQLMMVDQFGVQYVKTQGYVLLDVKWLALYIVVICLLMNKLEIRWQSPVPLLATSSTVPNIVYALFWKMAHRQNIWFPLNHTITNSFTTNNLDIIHSGVDFLLLAYTRDGLVAALQWKKNNSEKLRWYHICFNADSCHWCCINFLSPMRFGERNGLNFDKNYVKCSLDANSQAHIEKEQILLSANNLQKEFEKHFSTIV
ncbi:adenylate kinase [Trichinella pseudospiralis]